MANENLKSKSHWVRILYMLLFACVLYIVLSLVGLIVFVQIIFTLFTGKPNTDIKSFSIDLAQYLKQVVAYLLYLDDERPFPFTEEASENAMHEQNMDDNASQIDKKDES